MYCLFPFGRRMCRWSHESVICVCIQPPTTYNTPTLTSTQNKKDESQARNFDVSFLLGCVVWDVQDAVSFPNTSKTMDSLQDHQRRLSPLLAPLLGRTPLLSSLPQRLKKIYNLKNHWECANSKSNNILLRLGIMKGCQIIGFRESTSCRSIGTKALFYFFFFGVLKLDKI